MSTNENSAIETVIRAAQAAGARRLTFTADGVPFDLRFDRASSAVAKAASADVAIAFKAALRELLKEGRQSVPAGGLFVGFKLLSAAWSRSTGEVVTAKKLAPILLGFGFKQKRTLKQRGWILTKEGLNS